MVAWLQGIILKPAKFGAYSELFGGLSPDVTAEKNGTYIIPWGRFGEIPAPIAVGMKSKAEGGTGLMERFMAWCDAQTSPYH